MIGGSTAQFLSIIPVVIVATWLGRRDGFIAALLFIPILVALISVAQQQPVTYLLYEGRPAAIISLVVMAAVTGHASDLARRLDRQLDISDSVANKLRESDADRDALLELGVELANAHSVADVHAVADRVLRSRMNADRFAIVAVDLEAEIVHIQYVGGLAVPGFEIGSTYLVDDAWRETVAIHQRRLPRNSYKLPTDSTAKWKRAGFHSVLRIPLWERDAVSGYIALSAIRPAAFDESDREFLVGAAQHIGPHLRASAMLDASIQETKLRRTQIEIARAMAMASGFRTQCEIASLQMHTLLNFEFCVMAETRQGADKLRIKFCAGMNDSGVEEGTTFTWDPDLMYLDDEVRYMDLQALELGPDAFPFSTLAAKGLHHVAVLTLISEGEPLGLLIVASGSGKFESDYASAMMQSVGSHLANGIVRERSEAEQKKLLRRLES